MRFTSHTTVLSKVCLSGLGRTKKGHTFIVNFPITFVIVHYHLFSFCNRSFFSFIYPTYAFVYIYIIMNVGYLFWKFISKLHLGFLFPRQIKCMFDNERPWFWIPNCTCVDNTIPHSYQHKPTKLTNVFTDIPKNNTRPLDWAPASFTFYFFLQRLKMVSGYCHTDTVSCLVQSS